MRADTLTDNGKLRSKEFYYAIRGDQGMQIVPCIRKIFKTGIKRRIWRDLLRGNKDFSFE